MTPITVKEWAEEYRQLNTQEDQERRGRLRRRSVEARVRAYQSLCRLVAHLNPENDLALWEIRQAHYRDWEEKIRHIAREQGYDLPI